jgi:hypothetical protein
MDRLAKVSGVVRFALAFGSAWHSKEVDEMCAWALEHTAYETMEAEQFQMFSGAITQVRQVLDKRRTLLR